MKLREICWRNDSSSRSIARKAGISHVLLCYLQRGQRRLTEEVAQKISNALGVPLRDVWDSLDDDGLPLRQDGSVCTRSTSPGGLVADEPGVDSGAAK